MGPMVPVVDQRDLWSWPVDRGTPLRGRIRPREARRGGSPDGPPNLGFILVSFTSKFTNILGVIGW